LFSVRRTTRDRLLGLSASNTTSSTWSADACRLDLRQGSAQSAPGAAHPTGDLTDTLFPDAVFPGPRARAREFYWTTANTSLFDLGRTASDRWSVEVWNGRDVSFRLFPARDRPRSSAS
jgi:hypothetical protein